ncbi:MAG: hypothetical protein Ct9H300mP31_18890 [Acidimicrobiaceae bacterium]|nr:MAG: hypothetical protein Ct9H300mP31_18890 [Acidimicrobiaceae bacterium]
MAFGSTRRVGGDAAEDATLANLLAAETDVVCIVGKASAYHVTEALRTSLDEGVAMVADSVRFLKSRGRRVFFDAEHFFDGYRDNPEFSMQGPTGGCRGRRRLPRAVRYERRLSARPGGGHGPRRGVCRGL